MRQTCAASFSEHTQFSTAAIVFDVEAQFDIGLRDIGQGLVCPFDKADAFV
jgi:hypothetical protein